MRQLLFLKNYILWQVRQGSHIKMTPVLDVRNFLKTSLKVHCTRILFDWQCSNTFFAISM